MFMFEKKKNLFLRVLDIVAGFLDDDIEEDELQYDPAHIGAMIVLTMLGISILFWLFWSLLVFKGGLLEKVQPLFLVLFTQRDLAYFGYEYWEEQGIFNGWTTNLTALGFLFFLIWGIWSIFKKTEKKKDGEK